MQPRIFFVTGVVGAGKSSLVQLLEARLGLGYEVHDFDERGVPDAVDMDWGAAENQYWLSVGAANSQKGVSTIICGFALPSDDDDRGRVRFILLDLDEKALRDRLMQRYSDPAKVKDLQRMRGMTVEESVRENVGSIPWLRDLCVARGAKVIDTSALTPAQTVEQVRDWIRRESDANFS
jgi:RNase adaptor protein for sRNA GlmZ degradation